MNPTAAEILGHRAYPDLASLPGVPDIVNAFRKASDIPAVLVDVLAIGAQTVWGQLGIGNQDAAVYGESTGLTVVGRAGFCSAADRAAPHNALMYISAIQTYN